MTTHLQHSTKNGFWFDLTITQPIATMLDIPSGSCWVHGVARSLPAYTPTIGTGAFYLFVEPSGNDADYAFDLTVEYLATGFTGIGAPLVAWRNSAADSVHVLQSVT